MMLGGKGIGWGTGSFMASKLSEVSFLSVFWNRKGPYLVSQKARWLISAKNCCLNQYVNWLQLRKQQGQSHSMSAVLEEFTFTVMCIWLKHISLKLEHVYNDINQRALSSPMLRNFALFSTTKTQTDSEKTYKTAAAAAAKSLQSCLTLCDPTDGSPPGSPVPGILPARTLELVAISFSDAWKWKVKVKSLSRVRPSATPWTAAYQAPPSMGFSRQEYWSGVPLPSLIQDSTSKQSRRKTQRVPPFNSW